ncbi:MAG: DNA repair protein RadA, partial [Actinomycetota bacterium]
MGKVRTIHACSTCGQRVAQWAGRCPGCGGWGTIGERRAGGGGAGGPPRPAPPRGGPPGGG